MKNRIGWLAAFLLLTAVGRALALDADAFRVPYDKNKNLAESMDWVGVSVSSRDAAGTTTANNQFAQSTVGRQWTLSSGVLYDVAMGTGATTTYVVCADTEATTLTDQNDFGLTLLFPLHFAQATNTSWLGGDNSGGGRIPPIEFRVGLYCWTNAATRYIPYFRTSDQ